MDKDGSDLLHCAWLLPNHIDVFTDQHMIHWKPIYIIALLGLLYPLPSPGTGIATEIPGSITSVAAYHRALPRLNSMLAQKSMELGAPVFIRIFKRSSELEVWLRKNNGRFELFKTYIICRYSGDLGPKLKVGDKQAPEGFYTVSSRQMNPWSKNHLSFNLGYPNEYDQSHQRSGSALMVHGGCTSTGCYAMTDYYMDEIYTLADAALARGQSQFQVHIFPFRLVDAHLNLYKSSPWYPFWVNLKQGFELFERYRLPPKVEVNGQRYVFGHEYDRSIAQIRF